MNTNRMRTATAVVSATALALGLAACGSSDDDAGTGEESPDGGVAIGADQSVGAMEDFGVGTTFQATEPVTFSLMYRDHPNYEVTDDWSIFEHLEQDHGVTFSRTDIPLADWEQKRSLLIGSGEAADLMPVTYPGQETQFVSGGSLLPVSDYLEYLPNFRQKVEEWGLQEEIDNLRQDDDKYYMLPGIREIPDVQYSVVIRDDLWREAGITEDPQTWEEFAEDLQTVQDAHPELDYAFSDRWTDGQPLGALLNVMGPNFGAAGGWGYANTWYDEQADEFVFNGASDQYRAMLETVRGMVEAGVMDPEITQSDDQAEQKFISGRSAALSSNTQEITAHRTKFADAGVDAELRLLVIPGGPFGDNLAASRLSSGLMIASAAAEKPHFEALLQYIDWQYYSDEGIEFAQWGVEGETFDREADGTRTMKEDIGWNAINPDASEQLNADYGYSNGVFLLANGTTQDLLESVMSDEIKEWTRAVLERKETLPIAPAARLDELELEQTSLLDSQLNDAVQAATAAFITGQRSLDDWDAFAAEMEGLGASQIVETYNAAYARQSD
ncbi:extracellular solute-binding protein [Isoptericola halotolerans]|uniref:Aldouronate transport system substrate-binding protein n=1 Tax=Isoptericola halotolerans TaxID=300560 RepID=A0ABX1ZZQ3_9MICO|nr:extracellular solute-binding protein [Isoptericola halotolerans]NOV96000.1 putative aldouronate transport system substrate-binding protein [Isoptericola halotolerans]